MQQPTLGLDPQKIDSRQTSVIWLISMQLDCRLKLNFETLCLAVHYMDSSACAADLCHSLSLAAVCLMLAAKFMYEPEDNPLQLSRVQYALLLAQTNAGLPPQCLTVPAFKRMERAVLSCLDFELWQPDWTPYAAARRMCHCLQFSVSEKARLKEWFRMWLLSLHQMRYYDVMEVAGAGVWTAMHDHCWSIVSDTIVRLFHTGVSRINAMNCALKVVLLFNPDASCDETDLRSTI